MRATRPRTVHLVAVCAALALATSCSSESKSADTTVAPSTIAVPSTPPPTTVAETTIPPTTVAPTTVPAVVAPFLRGTGVGPYEFGAAYGDVLAGMPLVLMSDESYTFPHPELFFSHAAGRKVCWNDGAGSVLCAIFGGADLATVTMVGWSYDAASPAVGALTSEIEATVNKFLVDLPGMPAIEGACYTYTTVALNGIAMDLTTGSDEWFGTYADDGSWIPTIPVPITAKITAMRAGEQILGVGADC